MTDPEFRLECLKLARLDSSERTAKAVVEEAEIYRAFLYAGFDPRPPATNAPSPEEA